ncbi:olfactory receptor 1052-like [Rana temporaria]|uniref:olfactory receptor 1052-like n=1 Tax=Rana temporaria TaxID=8407 RepID=UPI001AAD75A1|nr:olfactory receptor 1052-like [Rana temporaria]
MVGNQTSQPEFILLGLSDLTNFQIPAFLLLILIYLATLAGNFLIIFLVAIDSHLQTPMYIFLGNLSILDISTPSVSGSHLYFDTITGNNLIVYSTCIAQAFFFSLLASTEYFLLAFMSYDRYVAICLPLHYTTIMSNTKCVQLASSAWAMGCIFSLVHTLGILRLAYCDSTTIISGFFCELYQLILLSCSDTSLNNLLIYTFGLISALTAFFITFLSYVYILKNILRIKMNHGRQKAFSTASSHLTVVVMYYSTTIFNYIQPKPKNVLVGRVVSVVYTFFTPFLNPLIYSLRNTELRTAAVRALVRGATAARP